MANPIAPPASCPIAWQPNALAPVFYGYREYGPGQGNAPVPLRVFFPSIDASPEMGSILAGCGRYPVILFAHGHCPRDEAVTYLRWVLLPAQLARAGYVVVVPQIPSIGTNPSPTHPALAAIANILAWLRHTWEHRQVLMPPKATGVAGHSFGGLHTAQVALTNSDVAAYAALSADWHNWAGQQLPILGIQQPKLVLEGGDELFPGLSDTEWNALSAPKHRAIFKNGDHWSYLPAEEILPCPSPRGPCPYIPAATADLLTMFFGKYLPPELAPQLPSSIPGNLFPPRLVLTPAQKPFAKNYLEGMRALSGHKDCGVTLIPAAYYSGAAAMGIGLANI